MNFTFDTTGTPQQTAWVREAIQACSYPLSEIAVPVTITWGPVPCGLAHTYMCTQQFTDGSFTITIEPWADDPTNVNNRGLPDPGRDIKDFYMQSFVHELGHVVHQTLVDSDDLRTKAAALFWTLAFSAGSGRRSGMLQDYSPDETTGIAWADSIQETIAECFKAAFYTGRLLFLNRTNWRIDEQEWPAFINLLTPPTIDAVNLFTEKFNEDPATFSLTTHMPAGYAEWSGALPFQWGSGELDVESDPTGFSTKFVLASNASAGLVGPPPLFTAVKVLDIVTPGSDPSSNTAAVVIGMSDDLRQSYMARLRKESTLSGDALHLGVQVGAWDGWATITNPWSNEVAIPGTLTLPLWLKVEMRNGTVQAEIWQTDPLLGGAPAVVLPWAPAIGEPTELQAFLAFNILDSVAGFVGRHTDWSYPVVGTPIVPPPLTVPYPFSTQAGAISVGPGSRGTLAVSG